MLRSPIHRFLVPLLFGCFSIAGLAGGLLADETLPKFVGGSSCAAAMCHGGGIGQKYVGAEHLHWIDRDRHATKAYQVLKNEVSEQMAKQLRLNKPADEEDVCLNCHSPATASTALRIDDRRQMTGVGCEQCHGAAERWIKPHVNWKRMKSDEVEAEKKKLGYRDLINVVTRAQVCADCHVGNPRQNREVNHDLIAAGHPRLFFEMSAFHANYPRHWPDEVDAKRHPENPNFPDLPGSLLEAKLWAIGQVVTAQRSLELISHRAANSQNASAKWPELADFNCFSCHHDLQAKMTHAFQDEEKDADDKSFVPPKFVRKEIKLSWRQVRDINALPKAGKRPRVLFELNPWPFAMLEPLARQTNRPDVFGPGSPLSRLHTSFVTLAPPAEDVARDAADSAKLLAEWAEQLNKGAIRLPEINKLRAALSAEDGMKLIGRDWDSATQLFLSHAALHAAAVAARNTTEPNDVDRDRQIQAVLNAINDQLDFEPELRSPSTFVPQPNDDPEHPLQSDLRKLQQHLGRP